MKKSILIIFAILIPYVSLGAQVKFGIKGGKISSAFYKNITGLISGSSFGMFIDLPNVGNKLLTFEINRSERGGILTDLIVEPYDYNPSVPVYSYDYYVKREYLDYLIIIKHNYSEGNQRFHQPYFGISISLPLPILTSGFKKAQRKNKKLVISEGPVNFDVPVREGYYEENMIFGAVIGYSHIYKRLIIDFRYFHGFTDVGGPGTEEPLPFQNYGLSFSIGFIMS